MNGTDISITFDDPGGDLDGFYFDIERNIEHAWNQWDFYIDSHPIATLEIVVRPSNRPNSLASAGPLGLAILSRGETELWEGGVQHELINGKDINGESHDILINISTIFLNQNNYYNFNPNTITPSDQVEFDAVMAHELGHALGFIGYRSANIFASSLYEINLDAEEAIFSGKYAMAALGGHPVSVSPTSLYHLSEEIYPSSIMSVDSGLGETDEISLLELAILADVGLPVKQEYLTEGEVRVGTENDDVLTGNDAVDIINMLSGNDLIFGSYGNDLIDGGEGIDTVRYNTLLSEFSFTFNENKQVSEVTNSNFGTDSLVHVERIEFTDRGFATDIDGSAGIAAKAIITAFGEDEVSSYMQSALSLTDTGASFDELFDLVVKLELIESTISDTSNVGFVNHVFGNVVGRDPSIDESNHYTRLLENGEFTKRGLMEYAAQTNYVNTTLQSEDVLSLSGITYDVIFPGLG